MEIVRRTKLRSEKKKLRRESSRKGSGAGANANSNGDPNVGTKGVSGSA